MPTDHETFSSPPPIRRRQAVEVFSNRFGQLYNDDVVSPGGLPGTYLRWQWAQRGVVVVPVGPGGMALVPTYRYPVGASSLEFPRGGCEPGERPEKAAVRELWEEAGLEASSVRAIGLLHADTGLIETGIHVCCATVLPGEREAARPESMESVAAPVWVSQDEMLELVRLGRISCSLTIAAFTLVAADRNALPPVARG